jgi:Zn-dependent protease with chaperone function
LLFACLYLGLVVGSAYLCYWSFASLDSSRPRHTNCRGLIEDVSRVEERVARIYNDALKKGQQGQMTNDRFLQILERDVLPPWQAQQQRLAQAKGLSRDEQRLVDQYRECFELQTQSWEWLRRALLHNDHQATLQAEKLMQQAEKRSHQFVVDASNYFRRHAAEGDSTVWLVVVGIVSGLLCLFLIKGFVKRSRADATRRLEVTEQDQPALFAFLRQLCRDTGAPFPHRVYLTAEVNAAVFYQASFLSLFLPTPKNLVIGLGLVNQLNLTEFKAVLAHEFGHFSQRSMKLGVYVYMSNRILGDLVFGRDWLDDVVAALRGADVRIAVFAWSLTGILWLLRQSLQGLFRVINFANTALLREMEFQADLVAVSVTGSDSLVHGLARLDFATDALAQAWKDLLAAADHHLYTRDLFYHQTQAAAYLRALRKDPRLGEPPALPDDPGQVVQVFQPADTRVPQMWATHPSNYDREVNAKRHYLRSTLDERSPWVLFRDAPELREKVTQELYQAAQLTQQGKIEAPEVVQAFIDAEHAETTYHPRYHGLYDQRHLRPGDLDELIRTEPAELSDARQLEEATARLHGEELKARMDAHWARQEEYRLLAQLAHGFVEATGRDFPFRGTRHPVADSRRLLDEVRQEIDQDYDWMARWDRQVFVVHHTMARQLGGETQRELEERYRFQLVVQEIHGQLLAHHEQVQATLGQLAGKRELTQEEYHGALAVLRQAYEVLCQLLKAADQLRLPALKNVTPGEPLGPFLMSRPLIPRLPSDQNTLDGEWISQFMQQLGEALDRAQRLHFKSLGGILALQEKLVEQWSTQRAVSEMAPITLSQTA